jgi:hypothetical protein
MNDYESFLRALGTGQIIQSPIPYNIQQALSTGGALAGVGCTAMAALDYLKNGGIIPIVITPLR